jgi:hypothetical protein
MEEHEHKNTVYDKAYFSAFMCYQIFEDHLQINDVYSWIRSHYKIDFLLIAIRYRKKGEAYEADSIKQLETAKLLSSNRLQAEFFAQAWPGSRFSEAEVLARIFVLRCDAELISIMASIEPQIFKWIKNGVDSLPEDICFINKDLPFPLMATVTLDLSCLIYSHKEPPWEHMLQGSITSEEMDHRENFFCEARDLEMRHI